MVFFSLTDFWQQQGEKHWQTGVPLGSASEEWEHDIWTTFPLEGFRPQQYFDLQVYTEGKHIQTVVPERWSSVCLFTRHCQIWCFVKISVSVKVVTKIHDALVWGNASPLCALYTRHCLQEMMTHQTKKKTTLTNQMWLLLMNCQVVQANKGKSMLYGPVPSNSQDYTVSATSQCLLWISFMYMHLPLSLALDNKLWAISNLLIVSLSFWMSLWSFCKIKKKNLC